MQVLWILKSFYCILLSAMKLKKLELLGFKSFADKTALEFNAGITAIVGPNGCGKSNVADAFRWVLGQSAKSMRGEKMDDVIFAGTSNRSQLNIAEVTITLADVRGSLPIDYEEVAITRRLHRSGESHYLINRNPVRLKDIHDLLLDSGIGKQSFSIFEQGKIDQIIHYTPLERRTVFEEAAGILRFLQRKRESLRKLSDVDTNLTRIKDIFVEVERQIVVLEQQAEQARVYKDNRVQLEQLELVCIVMKWDHLQKRTSDAIKKRDALQTQLAQSNQLADALEGKLAEAKEALKTSEQLLRSSHEEMLRKKSDKTIKAREHQSYQERIKEAQQKEQKWHAEREGVKERRRARHAEADTVQKQQLELEQVLQTQESVLQRHREVVRELETEVGELRNQQQKWQQEKMKTLQAENLTESLLKQNGIRLENCLEKKQRIVERQKTLVARAAELTEAIEKKKQELKEIAKGIDAQKRKFAAIDEELQNVFADISAQQKQRDGQQQEIAEVRARQKVLLRLREEMAGFSAGSKRLLQESANPKSPLHKLLSGLYEVIVPKKGAEAALAAVLRAYSQTLVVKTKEHFDAVLAFAKQHGIKEFSLICQETLADNHEASVQKLSSLLTLVAENKISRHFLSNVYVADTVLEAQEARGTSIWTKEGFYIDSQGVLFHTTAGENNAFLREAELKSLEDRLVALETAFQESAQALSALHNKRTELEKERAALDKAIRREEMGLVEQNFSVQRLSSEQEHAVAEQKQTHADLKAIDEMQASIAAAIEELTQKQADLKSVEKESQSHAEALQNGLNNGLANLKKQRESLQEVEAQSRKTMDDYKKALHTLQILEIKDQESQQQEQRLLEEIHSSQEMQAQYKQNCVELSAELQLLEAALSEASTAYDAVEKNSDAQKVYIATLEKEWQQEQRQSKPLRDEIQRLEINIAQLETTTQGLCEEAQTRYEITVEEARAAATEAGTPFPRSAEQAEQRIRMLRLEIEKAGNINMTAIEEFEKNKERHGFLQGQIADLEACKNDLVQIITQLDTESRKLFKETVEMIRVNFQKNFQILFNGGEADLQLTESSDVLEAGIDIIAKPPGKQMRSIQLMSGGEKCMTAMALLFAIFEVKPAPFCILDEIDAPLDEANVDRFLNVVKQFMDRCQFITITHNKRTMSAANVLFGVSMEEKGVSKLLSMVLAN